MLLLRIQCLLSPERGSGTVWWGRDKACPSSPPKTRPPGTSGVQWGRQWAAGTCSRVEGPLPTGMPRDTFVVASELSLEWWEFQQAKSCGRAMKGRKNSLREKQRKETTSGLKLQLPGHCNSVVIHLARRLLQRGVSEWKEALSLTWMPMGMSRKGH